MTTEIHVRLDKWLWAARFYKTRSLASQAISGGKVHYNEQRVKPSQLVNIGAQLTLKQGLYQKIIIVSGLTTLRRTAKEATQFYTETEASIKARMELAEQQRLSNASFYAPEMRPNKKQRRQIIQFKQQL
jgi:ribosome-associated heat shock protein Hsp15